MRHGDKTRERNAGEFVLLNKMLRRNQELPPLRGWVCMKDLPMGSDAKEGALSVFSADEDSAFSKMTKGESPIASPGGEERNKWIRDRAHWMLIYVSSFE